MGALTDKATQRLVNVAKRTIDQLNVAIKKKKKQKSLNYQQQVLPSVAVGGFFFERVKRMKSKKF